MKTLILILVSFAAYGQNYLTLNGFGNPEGVSTGHQDQKNYCYYLYFNPTYKQFHDDELTIIRNMMQFDLHVDEKSYDKWVAYTKQKYKFSDCIILDIKVVHKGGEEEIYTFESFKKYLWP